MKCTSAAICRYNTGMLLCFGRYLEENNTIGVCGSAAEGSARAHIPAYIFVCVQESNNCFWAVP